ncbi:PREDICTED: von Willebrand factor A domain-containing protein 7-like, partial [Bison bison bison]|uniref:von Willebrand factor A domain-containing protein 7-like n=1 Tax=Bison bison bison TaxID=43346 RepID=A0A6P3HW30_BISBB
LHPCSSSLTGIPSPRVPSFLSVSTFLSPAFVPTSPHSLIFSPIFRSCPLKVTLPLEPRVVVAERPLVFRVDGLLQKVTVRIHGEVSSFWIRNPAGVSQGQEEGEGPLGHTHRFGRFWMVRVNDPPQSGTWEIQVTAKGTPRVRVQAQTSLDFLFHFGIPMEDGPHPGLYPLTQPVAASQNLLLALPISTH